MENILLDHGNGWRLVFTENEVIGTNYMIYKFRIYPKEERLGYIGVRIVTYDKEVLHIIATIDHRLTNYIYWEKLGELPSTRQVPPPSMERSSRDKEVPPGQKYIPYFIIYRVFGQPELSSKWKLVIEGLVNRRLEYSYSDLFKFSFIRIRRDFHCVTGWSVKDVLWEGVPIRDLVGSAEVRSGAEWVYMYSLDGYTVVVPVNDFLSRDSLLVLKINGKPLSPEQGFPARIFIPHLYGWKGAKWVYRIVFIKNYMNGYWESLGYHERGNVWLEERFK